MYKSPIELLVTDIQNQIVKQQDEEIYKAVIHYVPNVDKEELIRALNYDRQQYQKGYLDGKADAAEVVHGRWEPHMEEMEDGFGKFEPVQTGLQCSVCGRYSCCGGNFCKDCGAKMEEG